jgi:hypothetical protein
LTALLVLAVAAGWYTARWTRARKDVTKAKNNVIQAKQILSVERRAFLLVAAIVTIVIWWWLDSHS